MGNPVGLGSPAYLLLLLLLLLGCWCWSSLSKLVDSLAIHDGVKFLLCSDEQRREMYIVCLAPRALPSLDDVEIAARMLHGFICFELL